MVSPSINRRQFGLWCALSTTPLGLNAQPRASERLRIAVGGQAMLYYLPLTVAHALGFFRDEGLDVEIQDHAGGVLALRAVQDGEADVCCGAYDHIIRQQAQGLALRSLVVLGRTPQLGLVASARNWPVRSVAGFKGMRVGVSAVGSSTQFLASLWLLQAGVPLEHVTFVGTGTAASALAALRKGLVHALCHADPVLTILELRGEARLLADARTLKGSAEIFGGSMPGACLFAPQAFGQRQPAQAQALANALVHALKWLQTAGPADLMRVVPQSFLLGDRGAYLAAFHKVRETMSPDGLMPSDGPATALRAVARLQPEVSPARVDLSKTYTNDWVRKAKLKFQV